MTEIKISSYLRTLLDKPVFHDAARDSELMTALDMFIHNESNPMDERALAVLKMDQCLGEPKLPDESYGEADVVEYMNVMKQVRAGAIPLPDSDKDDGSGN